MSGTGAQHSPSADLEIPAVKGHQAGQYYCGADNGYSPIQSKVMNIPVRSKFHAHSSQTEIPKPRARSYEEIPGDPSDQCCGEPTAIWGWVSFASSTADILLSMEENTEGAGLALETNKMRRTNDHVSRQYPELYFPKFLKILLRKQPLIMLVGMREWKEFTMTKSQAPCWDLGMEICESHGHHQSSLIASLWAC